MRAHVVPPGLWRLPIGERLTVVVARTQPASPAKEPQSPQVKGYEYRPANRAVTGAALSVPASATVSRAVPDV